jgi:diguanylate cyclase (GGDEF)-like protein
MRRLDLFALLLGIAAALVGACALAGYAFGIPALLRLTPATPALVLAGAAGLALGGIGVASAALSAPAALRVAAFCGAATMLLGTAAIDEHVLHVDLGIDWPALHVALGLLLLGAGMCRVVQHRVELTPSMVQESHSIQLTSVWMLSVIAVVAGVSTFSLAQYEYQHGVRADLARATRDRRSFLDYAIREHLQQVTLAARAFETSRIAVADIPQTAVARGGFSAWELAVGGEKASAGRFIEHPDVAIALSGPYPTELLQKDGRHYLRTRVPIRDGDRDVGHVIAEDPFPELARITAEAESSGDTAAILVCTAVDDGAQCLASRNGPPAARLPREAGGRPLPMSLALDREVGLAETLDFRGQRVVAAYGPVGFTGLGMVVKIDAAEINAPLGRRFGSAMALLAALVTAGVWLLRRRLAPLTRALVDAREQATRIAAQFKGAAESSLDAYFLMDAVRDRRGGVVDFRIRYLNASGEVLVARPSEDIAGRTLREVMPDEQARYLIARYTRIVATGTSLSEELRMSATDASAPWIAHQAVKLGDGVSVTARDITHRKNVERQLRSRAENDALTGLPNRALFFDRLGSALAQARQASSGVGVLFLDVDHFKLVNDTHGHAVGDRVLIEFGRRLRAAVRVTDTVARLGGDEFAILLPRVEGFAPAERIANDILDAMRAPFVIGALQLVVGTSIGAGLSAGHDTAEALVGRADRSLYHAKRSGRGTFAGPSERHAA